MKSLFRTAAKGGTKVGKVGGSNLGDLFKLKGLRKGKAAAKQTKAAAKQTKAAAKQTKAATKAAAKQTKAAADDVTKAAAKKSKMTVKNAKRVAKGGAVGAAGGYLVYKTVTQRAANAECYKNCLPSNWGDAKGGDESVLYHEESETPEGDPLCSGRRSDMGEEDCETFCKKKCDDKYPTGAGYIVGAAVGDAIGAATPHLAAGMKGLFMGLFGLSEGTMYLIYLAIISIVAIVVILRVIKIFRFARRVAGV
jgi:hypothetical protein